MIRTLALIFVFILIGCAGLPKNGSDAEFYNAPSLTEEMRELMLGDWCGEKLHADGVYQRWLVKRFPDGMYRIDFMTLDTAGKQETWSEYGIWGVRAPIYFTAMRGFIEDEESVEADTNEPVFYDAYKIIKLTEQEFTYRSYASGNVFTVNRVCKERA